MGAAADLVNAGYTGYQGWGDAEAQADFNATGGAGKFPSGGGGGGSIPSFNFDYAAEAEKAYGELGVYYDRILRESEGDLNLALSRLVEDYDRGLRVRKEDTAFQQETSDLQQAEADRQRALAERGANENVLKRGLAQKSLFDPFGGIGLGQRVIDERVAPYAYAANLRNRNKQQLALGLNRYGEQYGPEGYSRKRATVDTATKIERNKFKLEQERRKESGDIANQRGAQAYQRFLSNPDLV